MVRVLQNHIKTVMALVSGAAMLLPMMAMAQNANFGINLSGGKEPVEVNSDNLEMRDKDGVAVFSGNVAVTQGDRVLRTSKLIVYYSKDKSEKDDKATKQPEKAANSGAAGGLGSTGIERMEASGKVYIKSGTQVATGDEGVFDSKSNTMVLTGSRVVLTDGDNVATGCKLTAHMDTGKANLQSCAKGQSGRVSIIMERGSK